VTPDAFMSSVPDSDAAVGGPGGGEFWVGAIGLHLDSLRYENYRPGTVYQRGRTLRRLARAIEPDKVEAASTEQVRSYLSRPVHPETIAVELSHLRGFYRWMVEEDLRTDDPTAKIRRPRTPRRLPRPLSDEQVAHALAEAPDRLRPWFALAAYAGLRCCEIAPLRAEDVVRGAQSVIVVQVSKGGGMSAVPAAPHLLSILDDCELPGRGWMFRRYDDQPGHVTASLVSQLGARWMKANDIPGTMHQFRHWFGTNVLGTSGGNMRVAQELLRHASPVSTAIYTWVAPAETAAAVGKLPTFARNAPPPAVSGGLGS